MLRSSTAISRRLLLAAGLTPTLGPFAARAAGAPALQFPRDLGSHPDFAIEWWYVTGRVLSGQREFGFQLTFFRSRVPATQNMRSAFAARQLIFAHAAVTDVTGRKFWHDQRIAREGFEVATMNRADTGVRLRDWSLQHVGAEYRLHAASADFELDLSLRESQPVLLQGAAGRSRKGPRDQQFSFYYSLPQLEVTGALGLARERQAVQGAAWLDHEWSDALLDPAAVGWDWIGINLLDGAALTAFQVRDKTGQAIWDGGSFRPPGTGATTYAFSRGEVRFKPLRRWTSPAMRASYPVEWMVQTPADFYTVKAVIDDQELDSRASTGAVYWEGLSEVFDGNGRLVGRGYLEMTGYARPLRL